jgi:hypothetical protein
MLRPVKKLARKLLKVGAGTGQQVLHDLRAVLSGRTLLARPIGPPIMVVGSGHSGTTFMLAILGASSRIHCLSYETKFLVNSILQIEESVKQFNREAAAAGKPRWAEKTPHHIRHLDLLFRCFPDARVILMLRDGRDVACSFRERRADLADGIQRWLKANTAGEPFWGDPRVRVQRYENFIADPTAELTALMAFLGEPFDPAMLHPEQSSFRYYDGKAKMGKEDIDRITERPASAQEGEDHSRLRAWQARQPIFDGRGRWRRDMTPEDKEIFKREAGDVLIRYGYVADSNW